MMNISLCWTIGSWCDSLCNFLPWCPKFSSLFPLVFLFWLYPAFFYQSLHVSTWLFHVLFFPSFVLSWLFWSGPDLQIPHLRPTEYKRSRLSRNRRTVNRAYGGVLSGGAVRERYVAQTIIKRLCLRLSIIVVNLNI